MAENPTDPIVTGPKDALNRHTLLVITDSDDRLTLVATAIERLIPNSLVLGARHSEAGLRMLRKEKVHLVVAHRTDDLDKLPLLEAVRPETTAPIVAISLGYNSSQALAAGATRFLSSNQWHRAGVVARELLGLAP